MTEPTSGTHDDITDHDITDAMVQFGVGFVVALAWAWVAADSNNRARIKAAFPELWAQYREVVALKRTKLATSGPR